MTSKPTDNSITVDSTTGETALRIETRGLWLFSALSVATCGALMVVAGYATVLWIPFSQQHGLVDWNTANLFAVQLPEVLIAACTYVLGTLPLVKRHLHAGVRDGVGTFGFLAVLSLLLNLI